MLITGYSDLSLTRGGILQDLSSAPIWGAYFRLDNDIREVFPLGHGFKPLTKSS